MNMNAITTARARTLLAGRRGGTSGSQLRRWVTDVGRGAEAECEQEGYHDPAEEVLQDIRELLTTHAPPHQRLQLTPVPSDCPQYWMLGG
jgi:hypothetical protein